MINGNKGSYLFVAAILGFIAAGITIVVYKNFVNDDHYSSRTILTSDSATNQEKRAADKSAQEDIETIKTEIGNDIPGTTTIDSGNKITTDPDSGQKPEAVLDPDAGNYAQAVGALNKFAVDFYRRYREQISDNVFFSPYSIFSALGMIYEGADGKTADEIRIVFHLAQDNGIRLGSLSKLYAQINPQEASYQLSTANALWTQEGYPFNQDYLKTIENYYGGAAANLDFKNDAEGSRQTINKWISSNTNGKISEIFAKGDLNEATRLALTNAVYFKGKWSTAFEESLTQEKEFTTASGAKIKVQMMNGSNSFKYAETENFQAIEIPYRNNDLSMIVILPKNGKVKEAEDYLIVNNIAPIRELMHYELTDLFIPKFKFATSYAMNDTLIKMGMPTAFNGANADFTRMYDREAAGGENLYIGLATHKAYIDVNEEGTEAAAATGIGMRATSVAVNPEQPKIFNANHPFIFAITHNKTGALLFLGKVNNPVK